MEYLIQGEELAKIKAGFQGINISMASNCGGSDIYCSSDAGCGQWDDCVHPTSYAGCSGGTLKFPALPKD